MRDWFIRASVVGSATSIILHLSLVALAAVITVGLASSRVERGSSDGELILTLSPETELTEIGDAALDAAAPAINAPVEEVLADVPTAGVMEGPGGDDSPASGPGFGPIGEGLGGAGGGDEGDGQGIGGGGAGSGGASFFGVEAAGNRFAYIVDVSGSMAGDKIVALQSELSESLSGLLDHMSFLVMLYASDAFALGEREKWTVATPAGKKWALSEAGQLQAMGGTEPWPAFERIFTLKPAPDAIYFMTDGEFDPNVAVLISMRNKGSKKVPIHCITFVSKGAEEVMRKIATDSGGSYHHVAGPR